MMFQPSLVSWTALVKEPSALVLTCSPLTSTRAPGSLRPLTMKILP